MLGATTIGPILLGVRVGDGEIHGPQYAVGEVGKPLQQAWMPGLPLQRTVLRIAWIGEPDVDLGDGVLRIDGPDLQRADMVSGREAINPSAIEQRASLLAIGFVGEVAVTIVAQS